MRKEVIGNATLFLGDCRDILVSMPPVDAVITDPVWPNAPDGMFPVDDPYALFAETVALLPPARQLVVCLSSLSDPRFLQGVPAAWRFQQAVMLQYAVPNRRGRVLEGFEIAYAFGSAIPSAPGQRVIPSITAKAQPAERPMQQGWTRHPCPRTTLHQAFLVRWFSLPEAVILDPFMGSGTAGIAALDMGRKFIGIEMNEDYFDTACTRIEESLKRPRLFKEPVPEPEAML